VGGKEHAPQGGDRRKKSERTNGFLSVELFSADCLFSASKVANSQTVAEYFAGVAALFQDRGLERLEIFLDRATTHKTKMKNIFIELTAHLTIKTSFHLMPAYSPKLNLVEYAIHLIRQKILHHADFKTDLKQFESLIKELCDSRKLLTKEQVVNILEHIESLAPCL
jgi:transposase